MSSNPDSFANNPGTHTSSHRKAQILSSPLLRTEEILVKIKLTRVYVDDQNNALKFYTEVLGFAKKKDLPFEKFRLLTLVSPEEPEGPELLLEPSNNPITKTFQKALYKQGIPLIAFAVENLQYEYERMKNLGVKFQTKPTMKGDAIVAVFDDTCGNLIQLYQV